VLKSLAKQLKAWQQHLLAMRNHAEFSLRRRLAWSQTGYREASVKLSPVKLQTKRIERELLRHYPEFNDYSTYKGMCPTRWLENLNFLAMLHQAQPALGPHDTQSSGKQRDLRILEIGVKNWSTLPALLSFARAGQAQHIHIDGVEIDLWAVYRNAHSRFDALQYHLNHAQDSHHGSWQNIHVRLIEDDILNIRPPQDGQGYDLILWSLPFLTQETHSGWGLPLQFFGPQERLQYVSKCLLAPHGHLISTHQGPAESIEHSNLLHKAGLIQQLEGECEQPFLAWRYPRFLHVSQKQRYLRLKTAAYLTGKNALNPEMALKAF
jgi:hypothetical protein